MKKRFRDRSEYEKQIRDYIFVIAVCSMMQFGMMIVKSAYSTELIEITKAYGIQKATASIASTFYFIFYASMQFVFAKMIKKVDIITYTALGSVISAVLFFAVPFCTNIKIVWVIFAVSGICQASIWATSLSLFDRYLDNEYKIRAVMVCGITSGVSYSLDYALSGIFVKIWDWKVLFYVTSVLFLIISLSYFFVMKYIERKYGSCRYVENEADIQQEKKTGGGVSKDVVALIICTSLCIFFATCVWYSLQNWFPDMLSDCFAVSSSLSLFVSLFVPALMFIVPVMNARICAKHLTWDIAPIFHIISLVALLILTFLFKWNILFTFIITIVALVFVKGNVSLSGSFVPFEVGKFMQVGVLAAVTNGFSAVGASVGPLFTGYLIDRFGHTANYIACFAATVISFICAYFGKKFYNNLLSLKRK